MFKIEPKYINAGAAGIFVDLSEINVNCSFSDYNKIINESKSNN